LPPDGSLVFGRGDVSVVVVFLLSSGLGRDGFFLLDISKALQF